MRILIADDHGIVREGLRSLIEKEPDMEVVGEAINGLEAVELAKQLAPEVVIMDISMPGLNGIDATRLILSENPKVKIIVLSIHAEKHIVKEVLSAGCKATMIVPLKRKGIDDERNKAAHYGNGNWCIRQRRVGHACLPVLQDKRRPD